MKITILLTLVILAAAVFIGAHSPSFTVNSGSRPLPTPTSTPSLDLTTINVGGNKMCGIDGAGAPGSEKAKLNDLKNRFRLPTGSFQPITFDELLALNQGHQNATHKKIIGFPNSGDPNNQRAVT